MIEVQGYAVMAHRGFAELAERSGEKDEADRARELADGLQSALIRAFWWAEAGTFYLALDGKKRPRAAVPLNPPQLLCTGVRGRPIPRSPGDRLFPPHMW